MPEDQKKIANLTVAAAALGATAAVLGDFAAEIISIGRKRRPTIRVVEEIRDRLVMDIKNSAVTGAPIDQETEILRKSIKEFEKLADHAIAKGWQL